MHSLQATEVLFPRFNGIYPRGVDTAVAEKIGKTNNIVLHRVKGSCKEMAEIMGEYLFMADIGFVAKHLHVTPNITAIQWFSCFCYKYASGFHAGFFYIFSQDLSERGW